MEAADHLKKAIAQSDKDLNEKLKRLREAVRESQENRRRQAEQQSRQD